MGEPLYVAFVWHMHQPLYRDALTGRCSLPWVRLHAIKDYLHMADLLARYPQVHATVNLVPSLVEQLNDYARGLCEDQGMALSRQATWSVQDRELLLNSFFSINWDRFVRPRPAYARLLALRDQALENPHYFSTAYYRDLVAWFNLSWIDPGTLAADPALRRLVRKGRRFSRRDVAAILAKQTEIIARIIPTYRRLQERGQVELTTSPYYHPILPLLLDSHAAREASPGLSLPGTLFAHPEDAREQVRRAVESHLANFGRRPRGLWPPEGAVSQATAELLAQTEGLRWIASDESILARSLATGIDRDGQGHVLNPALLYQPYRVAGLDVVFRDRVLSDRIGFVYKHMPGPDAARDLLDRLHEIRARLPQDGRAWLVSIILDGENCWEEYPENGDPFLHALYQGLSADPELRAVTVSEFLDAHPPASRIERLAAGSWINGNLETWIGEAAQNQAWEFLARVREHLVAWQRENPLLDFETLEQAWREVYIAQGSDWFWWYYSHNRPPAENHFDREFRRHLGNVYRLLGLPLPGWLARPIPPSPEVRQTAARAYITPPLEAAAQLPEAWAAAGYQGSCPAGGSMQRGCTLLRGLYYGYDPQSLYLRLEALEPLDGHDVAIYLSLPVDERANRLSQDALADPGLQWPPLSYHRQVRFASAAGQARLLRAAGQEIWEPLQTVPAVRQGSVLELQVPLAALGLHSGDSVALVVALARSGTVCELLPSSGHLTFTLEAFG